MTNLTEQWKKGELTSGWYYINSSYYANGSLMWCENGIFIASDNVVPTERITEVLKPVPSYEEWQAKLEENTKLKELLKQARESVYVERASDNSLGDTIWNYTTKLINEINQALGEDK